MRAISDSALEAICARSEGMCGCNCRQCEAFQANLRWQAQMGMW